MTKYSLRNTCLAKRKIKTLAKAEARAKDQTNKAGAVIEAYLCPYCDNYHTGHRKRENDINDYFKLKGNI